MKYALIVDVSQMAEHRKFPDCYFLGDAERPRIIHLFRDSSESELLRLQAENPLGDYRLFEEVCVAVPTRTNPSVLLVEPANESR